MLIRGEKRGNNVVEDEAQLANVCQSLGSKEVSVPGSNEQTKGTNKCINKCHMTSYNKTALTFSLSRNSVRICNKVV